MPVSSRMKEEGLSLHCVQRAGKGKVKTDGVMVSYCAILKARFSVSECPWRRAEIQLVINSAALPVISKDKV